MRSYSLLVFVCLGCNSEQPPHVGKSLEELIRMAESADVGQQIQASIGLAKLGDKAHTAIPALRKLLESNEISVRENAVNALGHIGSAETVTDLGRMLADPQWTVRRQAVLGLGKLGDPKGLKQVERLLKDPDALVRKAAQEVIKKRVS